MVIIFVFEVFIGLGILFMTKKKRLIIWNSIFLLAAFIIYFCATCFDFFNKRVGPKIEDLVISEAYLNPENRNLFIKIDKKWAILNIKEQTKSSVSNSEQSLSKLRYADLKNQLNKKETESLPEMQRIAVFDGKVRYEFEHIIHPTREVPDDDLILEDIPPYFDVRFSMIDTIKEKQKEIASNNSDALPNFLRNNRGGPAVAIGRTHGNSPKPIPSVGTVLRDPMDEDDNQIAYKVFSKKTKDYAMYKIKFNENAYHTFSLRNGNQFWNVDGEKLEISDDALGALFLDGKHLLKSQLSLIEFHNRVAGNISRMEIKYDAFAPLLFF